MSQHTVFVENLADATSYYQSVFGLQPKVGSESSEPTPSLSLSASGANKQGVSLLLVEDALAAMEATKVSHSMSAIEWHSAQFWEDYHAFSGFGVVFESLPNEQAQHKQVTFMDAYGVHWQLIATE
ncbi:VOC family protein [Marinomonas pollencensis]|uniref:Glyoxalase/fosfomycin resistance/dioxygenase domain-containing protein n=1 Tax=Marinomonas pollencensis TaxID=491954 RepID=A0A3E0DTT9_9GAMM|nr:VOC family protein [Marinomonas pollencensis]REG86806.1 hypothetical protein DFP81_101374 [Marinomonas pollencensis]